MKWRNDRKWTDPDEYEVLVPDPAVFKQLDPLSAEERAEVFLTAQKHKINQAR